MLGFYPVRWRKWTLKENLNGVRIWRSISYIRMHRFPWVTLPQFCKVTKVPVNMKPGPQKVPLEASGRLGRSFISGHSRWLHSSTLRFGLSGKSSSSKICDETSSCSSVTLTLTLSLGPESCFSPLSHRSDFKNIRIQVHFCFV